MGKGKRSPARYVYDSGEIWRLTERQYRQYIFGCVNRKRAESVSMEGVLVGVASFNATQATLADFENEAEAIRAADRAKEASRK